MYVEVEDAFAAAVVRAGYDKAVVGIRCCVLVADDLAYFELVISDM